MEKGSPVDMRKCLEMVSVLSNAGILFVPMPVTDSVEMYVKMREAMEVLDRMSEESAQ